VCLGVVEPVVISGSANVSDDVADRFSEQLLLATTMRIEYAAPTLWPRLSPRSNSRFAHA
jgi:hypothetical protein